MTSFAPNAPERTYTPAEDALLPVYAVAHPTRPTPFLIDADNAHAGRVSTVAEAHATGAAYALTVAPDVLAFDLDTAAFVMAGNTLRTELSGESWPVLLTESGRPGHRHLWAVVPDAPTRARFAARAAELGLPPSRTTMRPPGAPHRLGLPVAALDDPDDFAAAADAVRTATRPDHFDWRDLLAMGRWPRNWAGRDLSGSAKVWHICIGAIRAGHRLDEVAGWLADPANAGGTAYRVKLDRTGKRHASHWLAHSVWPSATKAAAVRITPPADAAEARERLCALADAIAAERWVDKAGATDRALLTALVARALARGSLTPSMSLRELAEAAPCSLSTAARGMARLVAVHRWVQVADRGLGRTVLDADGSYREQAKATRWRLLTPARDDYTGGTPPAGTPLYVVTARAPVSSMRAALDVCRWRGLGLNAPRVLDALADGSRTDAELAEELGLHRGNLRARLLPKLAFYGLVTRSLAGWAQVDDLDAALEAAAERLDLTGKADEVAARHAAETAAYLDHRDHLRWRRAQAKADRIAQAVAARRARATLPLLGLEPEPPFRITSAALKSDRRSTRPASDLGKLAPATHGFLSSQPTHEVVRNNPDMGAWLTAAADHSDTDAPPPTPPPTPLEALCAPVVAGGGLDG
jgi:hypothetical protein